MAQQTFGTAVFLEVYYDKNSVISGGVRTPQHQYQNHFGEAVPLFVDPLSSGVYPFLAFDVEGFVSSFAAAESDFTVKIPGTAEMVQLTETLLVQQPLIIAFLYRFSGNALNWDSSTPILCTSFFGEFESADTDFISVTWTANSGFGRSNAQIPSAKLAGSIIQGTEGQ